MANISAGIVVYGGFEEAAKAAESLLAHTASPFQLFLIDNNSPDGAGQKMAETFGGRAEVLCLEKNLGFGGGHNQVLPLLKSDYHAVVNPDIEVKEDVLAAMAAFLDAHPEVVAVVPKLLFPNGEEQFVAKRLPSFMALLSRHIPFPGARKIDENYLRKNETFKDGDEIEFCTGCFFMMRSAIFKEIGGFDPRYFMYFEDVDIGREAAKHGKIAYLPSVTVYHAWHRDTTKKAGSFLAQLRSMFVYFKKWGFKFI